MTKEYQGVLRTPKSSLGSGEVFNNELQRLQESTPNEVQEELNDLITKALKDPNKQQGALNVLRQCQEESLHLENPDTKEKTPINVSMLPVVIDKDVEKGLRTFTQHTGIVRAATLMTVTDNPLLSQFLTSGVHPLAVEIMNKTSPDPKKAQWRVRLDSFTNLQTGDITSIECNGGEPQGDAIISDAQRVFENVISEMLDLGETMIQVAPYPEEQMMKVMSARHRLVTGEQESKPRIGYFAWRNKSSLSELEAKFTAKRYHKKYGTESTDFDPREITNIRVAGEHNGKPHYIVVVEKDGQTHEIDIIRRLHGEPFENMDLWQEFKEGVGSNMCSDGKATIWDRFTGFLADQMVNPLNSWATDKKLDVILGNPDYLKAFGIWGKVEEMLNDPDTRRALSLPSAKRIPTEKFIESIKDTLGKVMPQSWMLRRQSDGLYQGDIETSHLGLPEEEIEEMANNRDDYVIKKDTLEGHGGKAVHVGKGINMEELDFEEYQNMTDDELIKLTGMNQNTFADTWENGTTRADSVLGRQLSASQAQKKIRDVIKSNVKSMSENELSNIKDRAWKILIENSLNSQSCLIQKVAKPQTVEALVFNQKNELVKVEVYCDLDPQSIGVTYTLPIIRVSSASKTNITGGYGAFAVPISLEMAKNILALAKQKKLV